MKVLDERFDLLEIRAARNMDQADHYWKHHLTRIPAARKEIGMSGFLPKMRRVLDAVLLQGGLR